MRLLLNELNTTLVQKITATENVNLYAIRPHIYIHNAPSGSLRVDLLDSNQKLIASSNVVAISTMTTLAYFHGYIRFLISAQIKEGQSYYVRLNGVSGYSYGASFVGWCNDFDLRKYTANYSPNDGWASGYDMEIWGYKDRTKGFY